MNGGGGDRKRLEYCYMFIMGVSSMVTTFSAIMIYKIISRVNSVVELIGAEVSKDI